jgi:protein-tyrosine phosphatase
VPNPSISVNPNDKIIKMPGRGENFGRDIIKLTIQDHLPPYLEKIKQTITNIQTKAKQMKLKSMDENEFLSNYCCCYI